ncbi:hypothetical protein N7540_001958 [Penicillium herquei]|nr:hypothetical protein N7540_001958 [Penicillium herquei]
MKMPLEYHLEIRCDRLNAMCNSLWALTTEDIPQEMLQDLGIEFNPMDIHTGDTNPSVTRHFLPRVDFPSCRDMNGRFEDPMWKIKSSSWLGEGLPVLGKKTQHLHELLPKALIANAFLLQSAQRFHWIESKYRFPFIGTDGLHDFRVKLNYENDSNSHFEDYIDEAIWQRGVWDLRMDLDGPEFQKPICANHGVMVVHIRQPLFERPSVTEVILLLGSIMDGTACQIEGLKLPTDPPIRDRVKLYKILPRMIIAYNRGQVRILYAYFDDGKLRVQYTPLVSFKQFEVIPPSGVRYADMINWSEYQDNMDILIKWFWPKVPELDVM